MADTIIDQFFRDLTFNEESGAVTTMVEEPIYYITMLLRLLPEAEEHALVVKSPVYRIRHFLDRYFYDLFEAEAHKATWIHRTVYGVIAGIKTRGDLRRYLKTVRRELVLLDDEVEISDKVLQLGVVMEVCFCL